MRPGHSNCALWLAMGRTKELPIEIEDTYRQLLCEAIRAAGTQDEVEARTGVDQTTISKLLNGTSNPSYTTLLKLASELGLPAPFVPIRDAAHARWCALGAQLAAHRPDAFQSLLQLTELAVAGVSHTPTTDQVDKVKAAIASIKPSRRRT